MTGVALAQETPKKPSPPVMTSPAVHNASAPSASPKGTKHHWAELKWKASPGKGIEGYNVYRADVGSAAKDSGSAAKYELITAHPVKGTEYRDGHVEAGKTYLYAVTAVQKMGKRVVESDRTPPITARIPNPK